MAVPRSPHDALVIEFAMRPEVHQQGETLTFPSSDS
jgi:hypothetical protein